MLDVWAVYWKECKELLAQGNKQMLMRLLLIALIGVWFPLQVGKSWLQLPLIYMVIVAAMPLFIALSVVPDVFAGERERHTLETLLASRLSNWSIIVGKVACIVTLAWGSTIISLLLGCIIANVNGGMSWTFYPLTNFFIVVGLSLFMGILITLIGMLFSLHASTVRQVQQSISYYIIGAGFLITVLLSQMGNLPFLNTKALQSLNGSEILLLVIVGIAVIDIVLMLIALARFQRSRLILD